MSLKTLKQATAWRGEPLFNIVERGGSKQFDFVSEDFDDFESFGFNKDSCVLMHPKFTWANVAAHIGLFPSAGQAKKNGFDIPIEPGYEEAVFIGKNGQPVFVFLFKTNLETGTQEFPAQPASC